MNKHSLIVAMMVACGVVTLSTMAGCAVTSGQSSVGQYVDDKTITARVKTRMAADPMVSAMRIDVTTLNGTVQLSGFATNPSEKAKAGEIAAAVPDVKSVRNDIVVRAPQ
jgi:hyperosmotically inducible periplasmic protein